MNNGIPPRILVIDDDIDLLMLLERILQKQHYEVDTAVSISEAEEVIPLFQNFGAAGRATHASLRENLCLLRVMKRIRDGCF